MDLPPLIMKPGVTAPLKQKLKKVSKQLPKQSSKQTLLSAIPGIVCTLLLLTVAQYNLAEEPATSKVKSGATVLILGDSISAAYGMGLASGWVRLLEERLNGDLHHLGYQKVINASISGETSAGGLRRLPDLLEKYAPALTIIELGANDGLRGYPLAQVEKNLDKLITLSKASGSQVYLLGMKIPPNYGQRYTDSFYQLFHTLAQDHNIPLLPFFLEAVAGEADKMQADGIHPSASAQTQLLENLLLHLPQHRPKHPAPKPAASE